MPWHLDDGHDRIRAGLAQQAHGVAHVFRPPQRRRGLQEHDELGHEPLTRHLLDGVPHHRQHRGVVGGQRRGTQRQHVQPGRAPRRGHVLGVGGQDGPVHHA